jgi:hypothetical protein
MIFLKSLVKIHVLIFEYEGTVPPFFNYALVGGEGSSSYPGCLTCVKISPITYCMERLDGLQKWYGHCGEKSLPAVGNKIPSIFLCD